MLVLQKGSGNCGVIRFEAATPRSENLGSCRTTPFAEQPQNNRS